MPFSSLVLVQSSNEVTDSISVLAARNKRVSHRRGQGAMADDRNNHRGFVRQPHGVGHSSPPPPAPSSGPGPGDPTSPRSVQKENSPPRGPRTLLLRRSENGYGFTLRHFIVYPPESCCMLPGHERTKIDEPMDTIFVKQVRANSPAAEAGLRTGDRVVSVDGAPTRGEQYSSVVQRIQQAGPWLRLLVVSKEDDILQRYFGDTAHNPETNPRPRLRSPERLSQKQRRSMSTMISGGSPRTRQSWVCSLPSSESPNHLEETMCRMTASTMSQVPIVESQSTLQQQQQQRRGVLEASSLYDHSEDSRNSGRKQQLLREDNVRSSGRLSLDSKYDLYDRTRPESVYSRPSNEQLYDRINDPIYERVRVSEHHPQHYYQPSMPRYPMSQAEPQVPIYRPIKRMVARRASEGSGTLDSESASYGSIDALRSNESSRLSIESRRDSSPAASKDSMSPYDSNSTLTGNECSDDSVIMNRLRKSFEQKAEFLRRPSHPIGWSAEPSSQLPPNFNQASVIQREFYARPQKLQRQIWPPGQSEQQQRQQSPTRRSPLERNVVTKTITSLVNKPSNQSVQRIKDVDSNSEYSKPRNDQQLGDNQSIAEDHCYSPSLYDNELTKEYRGKGSFVSILSRIQENISMSQQQTSQETRNGSSSLPSSPGPDKKTGGDVRFPVLPQGLQIVSRRAKQFESGRLLSDEDEPAGDRTNLYKSELSRLSNKRSVPNVAVRKREFESKAENQDSRRLPVRETKSLDTGAVLTGNRIIPIGSKHIHCEPPADYKESKDVPTMETESVRLRARSNSADSWEATNGPAAVRGSARHTWQTAEEEGSTEDNSKAYRNQDNYLQSTKLQIAPVNGSSPNGSTNNAAVLRRQKNTQISDEDRATRRVSYLKATWGERMHVDSDLELSDSEPVHIHRSAHRRWRPPLFTTDITPLRRIFEDMTQAASLHRNFHHRNSIAVTHNTSNSCNVDGTAKDVEPVEREGTLHVKFTVLDGKRSTDRSWKQVWGVLRGPIIYFYKDRHSQSPSLSTESETNAGQSVDVRCSVVDVAEDYTKRKHVLRVANPTAEVLLQTEDAASMALWLRSLHSHAAAERSSDAVSCTSKQQAVPQTPTGPTTPNSGVPPSNAQRLSPLPGHKGIKKLTSFRNRSPTGQSPVNKTRKPSTQMVEPLPSPKSKTWKGRMAKQFRKMHGQAGAPSSPTAQLPPEGATFKVPLELCPPSSFSEYVPLIVEMCTSIVEARGLEVVGIYRVPGNTAAIAQLTDSVNRGFENINLQDPRWSDVNVISSLLKSFFRQLPDSLLTADLYPMFIDADKIEDPQRRMTTIRKLLRDLPEHHFETLKYLMQHLKKIVEHSEVNKMEAKNLAIVFGPTLVRASGSRDNMVTMVTDMSHQCRIVESLLNNVDWFFSEDDLDDLSRLSVNLSLPTDTCEVDPASNHSLLLNNIQKIEGMRDMASARDIVSSIISAANKKIQRRRKNQDEIDNSEHDNDKPSVESICLPPVRYGSLDSLHEVHNLSQSSPSPSQQQRGLPGDGSDDAGSCFLQWTQKILTINKKLSRHTASPGFWWYISSHLYGTAGPGSAAPKTPAQSPMSMPVPVVAAVPMPMSVPVPVSVPATTGATATAAAAASSLATAVASAATTASSSSSANNEPATAAKTLNRFLRGSDLLTSLTTTFDRKWRSLINQSSNSSQNSPLEAASCNKDITEQQEQKPSASPRFKYPSAEAYRDPSLHKSLDKSHLSRSKNDVPEKDTDSTVADNMSHPSESVTPNNDRGANDKQKLETKSMTNNHATNSEDQKDVDEGDDCAENPKRYDLTSEKNFQENKSENNDVSTKVEDNSRSHHYETGDSSYSNKLKKFESLTNSQARSRLKRSESLNKRTCENTSSRLKRSESLNKHSTERLSPLKRSESLNKHHSGDRSESPGSKLKRSESLTKTEKTECNISKRRQSVRKESATKLKRKNGMSERSIKRRHTVGSTKDFDKVHWLDNKLQSETERVIRSDYRPKKSQLRTSSPDLSTNRVGMADTSFLIEVSFRGPSNVVFNVTNARPQSLPDASLASKVFKVPLESHV
ncbi:uncharacterized protein LOC105205487 isoform X9 [Solenopsis invicta]|uniref:uncharacterized protein LOC105205487 isoform X9 n=1 Tax=Solenopsis invicta TaxID=13686 RepID=UPI00193E78D1|nr:uncharacterized protein LOC105205487 isoform X9 [Solenopsis invicta]